MGFHPICALRSRDIDGFAKMPLQASIFASWYNEIIGIKINVCGNGALAWK